MQERLGQKGRKSNSMSSVARPRFGFYFPLAKRASDIVISAITLTFLAPFLATISMLIKLDSPGPVFFTQNRCGKDGKVFKLIKFRSMSQFNDVRDVHRKDDITRVGKVLRRFSLDELPQFINVLCGDMSLIGPRPWLPEYYSAMNEYQRQKYKVRPGISGLAQAEGRNGISIIEKINYDVQYVQKITFLGDLRIVLKTIATIFDSESVDLGKQGIRQELDELREANANSEVSSSKRRVAVFGVTVDHAVAYHTGITKMLTDAGWDVHFVSSGGPNLENLDPRVRQHVLSMERQPSPMKDLVGLLRWINLLRKLNPDLVIAGTPKASMLAMVASRILDVPSRIYFIHGLRLETAKGALRRVLLAIEKLTVACSTEALAVSPSLKDKLVDRKIAKSDKISVIGGGSAQGVDTERFRPAISESEKNEVKRDIALHTDLPTIGFVGRMNTEKGINEFANALTDIRNRGLNFQVLMVGPSEDESSEAFSEQMAKNDIPVVFTGNVSDVERYYRAMDIFCLPSYREGLPTVILEAFATRIPVVGTQATGIVDLIEPNVTGLVVPIANSSALADALATVLEDPRRFDQIAENGFRQVSEHFSQEKIVADQLEHITSLFQANF